MGDIYASVIGTTILQLKELPPRPPEYDGKLCLFDLAEGVDEGAIRAALAPAYGEIVSCTLGGFPPAIVCFTTHEAARAAKRAAAQLAHIAGGIDTLWNERSYDGRLGVIGFEDDEGRGWCVFESSISGEIILRLLPVPWMRAALEILPRKMLALRSDSPLEPVDLTGGQLETRVAEVTASIERATFTGKGDKPKVVGMYKEYVGRIAGVLQSALALTSTDASTASTAVTLPS